MQKVIDFQKYKSDQVMQEFLSEQAFVENLVQVYLPSIIEYVGDSESKDQLNDKIRMAATTLLSYPLEPLSKERILSFIASDYIRRYTDWIEDCIKDLPEIKDMAKRFE